MKPLIKPEITGGSRVYDTVTCAFGKVEARSGNSIVVVFDNVVTRTETTERGTYTTTGPLRSGWMGVHRFLLLPPGLSRSQEQAILADLHGDFPLPSLWVREGIREN